MVIPLTLNIVCIPVQEYDFPSVLFWAAIFNEAAICSALCLNASCQVQKLTDHSEIRIRRD